MDDIAPPADVPARGPRRVPGRVLALVVVFGLALSGSLVYLGATASGEAAETDALIVAARSDLDEATADLAAAEAHLAESKQALEAIIAERSRLAAEVEDLDERAAAGGRCLTEQSSLIAELSRIGDLDTDNFNRTTEGSTWAKAFAAADTAVTTALDRYYDAYSEAFFNRDTKAKQYATQAAAAVEKVAAQRAIMAAEQKAIDATALEVQAALDAAEQRLVAAEQTCGETGSAD